MVGPLRPNVVVVAFLALLSFDALETKGLEGFEVRVRVRVKVSMSVSVRIKDRD